MKKHDWCLCFKNLSLPFQYVVNMNNLYVIAELYFHTFEEGLEVEIAKTNPAAVTLVGCPVERENIHGSKYDITDTISMHIWRVSMSGYLDCFGLWLLNCFKDFFHQKAMATDQKTRNIHNLGFSCIMFLNNIQHFFWLCASDWHSSWKGPSFLTRNTVYFIFAQK